jgi:predicted O-linked N-acetylglucosamine transferase (SPINDLY family)
LGCSGAGVDPFRLLPLEDAPDRHLLRSKNYSRSEFSQKELPLPLPVLRKAGRIRLAYFSTDFKEHPVSYLLAKVLEQHDRDRFEIFGYSLHGKDQSNIRQRIEKSFDNFQDVEGISDLDIAHQARKDEIDIAVDLNGFTQNARTAIFAYRAAPIQINYLGYPGTLGADFIDYIIADTTLIPDQNQKYFSEKPIYLPNTYMPTDDSRVLSQKEIMRSDLGLPEDAFVFCCFNNNYKISSAEFDIWMRILSKVPNSVLWLRKSNSFSHINLSNEAIKRKIDPSRIIFAEKMPMPEHLARHRLADLFIDTFAFNAHTTATEALWAGLPVVTKLGQGFAARVAASLLNAVGLPELITKDEKEYENLILTLASKPRYLAKIKEKLLSNLSTHPLFDTEQYTKHLEDGFQQAYNNYYAGNPPMTIIVPK